MQNIDPGENTDTLTKFENLQLTEPTSLESLTIGEQHKLLEGENSRNVHSDPEESQAKAKTRSRFTIALRKLSRSTRKKEKPIIRGHSSIDTESSEQIISSGTEDLPETSSASKETDKKSKKKKKTSKSIFGLKKSKVIPKQDVLKQSFEEHEQESAKVLVPIFQDNKNEVVVTTERLTPQLSRSKVQITIKSKKIETLASQEQLNENPSTSSLSSTPSPFPSSNKNEPLDDDKSKAAEILTKSSNDLDKKLKTKDTTQTPHKSTTTTQAQSKSKQQPEEQEKIIITQSSKDKPPKEKAPTKPSRLTTTTSTSSSTAAETSQSSKSIGAVRKTTTTTKAAIRLVTGAKSKQKTSSAKISKGSNGSNTSAATNQPTASSTATLKEKVLMINPQRGYRLPRPTTTETAVTTPTNTTKEPQVVADPVKTEASNDTQAIDEKPSLPTNSSNQKQTATSTTTPTTTTSVSLTTNNKVLPQTSSEIQSSLTNASLATSPPPVPVPTTTITATDNSDTTSEQQQRENIQTSPIDISKSVQLTALSQADDHISLAESVRTSEYLGNPTLSDFVESLSVNFAVGNPVRNQSSHEQQTENLIEGEKESSLGETNLRRIQYISQPSLFDELSSSFELKRTHRYQSGVSDLSLDTYDIDDTFDNLKPMPAFGDLTMDQEFEPSVMTASGNEKREHLYKILVIGELGTGKTSFIKRYVHQFFSQNYRATIGVDFALKVLHWDQNTIVRLQLWDIAGQERFGNMTRVYYKEAVGAFIVFDVTRSGTFDCVSKWKEDLDSKVQLPDGSPIPCILLANKCDQDKQGVVANAERMDEYVKEHDFAGWFETSAKENINIDEAARALVNKILLNDKLISAADLVDSETINLNNQTATDGKDKCSC